MPVYEGVEFPTSGVIEARDRARAAITTAVPRLDGKKKITGALLVEQVGDLVT